MRLVLLVVLFTSALKAGHFIGVVSNTTGSPLGADDNIPVGCGLQVLADSALFTRALDFCGELKSLVESNRGLLPAVFNDLVLKASGMVNDPLTDASINYYLACLAQRSGLQKSLEARLVSDYKARLENNSYGAHYLNLLNRYDLGVAPEFTEHNDSFSDSDYSSGYDSSSDDSLRRFMPKRVHFPDLLAQVREITPYSYSSCGDDEDRRIRSPLGRLRRKLNISIPKASAPRLDKNGEVDLSCHLSDEESDEE